MLSGSSIIIFHSFIEKIFLENLPCVRHCAGYWESRPGPGPSLHTLQNIYFIYFVHTHTIYICTYIYTYVCLCVYIYVYIGT